MSVENNKELSQQEQEEEGKEESKTNNGKNSKKLKELVLPNDSNVAKGNV
jgi:dephospho-CoA kinase